MKGWGRGLEHGLVNVDWTPGHISSPISSKKHEQLGASYAEEPGRLGPLAECGLRTLEKVQVVPT
jgi:hypothetical protein